MVSFNTRHFIFSFIFLFYESVVNVIIFLSSFSACSLYLVSEKLLVFVCCFCSLLVGWKCLLVPVAL
jgi:hypothetical protein